MYSTFNESSKLLDNSICPSLENLIAVISSEWALATWMSGPLPHPGLRFHIYMNRHSCKQKHNALKQDNSHATELPIVLLNVYSAKDPINCLTCIYVGCPNFKIKSLASLACREPSPTPPAMRFPSRSQAHVVTGTLPGLASFGLMT